MFFEEDDQHEIPQADISEEKEWRSFGDITAEWAKSRIGGGDDINLSTVISDPKLAKMNAYIMTLDPLDKFTSILDKQLILWNSVIKSPKISPAMITALRSHIPKVIHLKHTDALLYMLGYMTLVKGKIDKDKINEISEMRQYHSFEKTDLVRGARMWTEVHFK